MQRGLKGDEICVPALYARRETSAQILAHLFRSPAIFISPRNAARHFARNAVRSLILANEK